MEAPDGGRERTCAALPLGSNPLIRASDSILRPLNPRSRSLEAFVEYRVTIIDLGSRPRPVEGANRL